MPGAKAETRMKAIRVTREGHTIVHVPVERERQVYVGLLNLDDHVSVVAHSRGDSGTAVSERFWVDEEIQLDESISLTLVDVPEVDEPEQQIETPVGSARCAFCGEIESDVGDLYRGKRGLAKICRDCVQLATNGA